MKKSDICLAHSLRSADRVVSQHYNEYLAPLGVRNTQFSILRMLHKVGTTTATHIQDALVLDQTTVSRAVKLLIRDGHVIVGQGQTKREKALSLTKEGEKLYQQALGPWQQAQKSLRKKLGPGKDELLIELSRLIISTKG
ncbi:MAG: MarR family transcriptional regulator [Pseudomonadota bacterium]